MSLKYTMHMKKKKNHTLCHQNYEFKIYSLILRGYEISHKLKL